MRVFLFVALLNTGCVGAAVRLLTMPLDARIGDPQRWESAETIQAEETGNETRGEEEAVNIVEAANGVYYFQCFARPVCRIEVLEKVRITQFGRYRIYNLLGDILEVPATIADFPGLVFLMLISPPRPGGDAFFHLTIGPTQETWVGVLRRGLTPGTNVETDRTFRECGWEETRLAFRAQKGEIRSLADREAEVTLGAQAKKLMTDARGILKVDVRHWGLTPTQEAAVSVKIRLTQDHAFEFFPAVGVVVPR